MILNNKLLFYQTLISVLKKQLLFYQIMVSIIKFKGRNYFLQLLSRLEIAISLWLFSLWSFIVRNLYLFCSNSRMCLRNN